MAAKLGKAVTHHEEHQHKKLQNQVKQQILYIYSCTKPMTAKHGKVVTLLKWIPLKNYGRLPQWGGHVRSRDKLNTFYLHFQETYGHQTMQGTVLLWEARTLKAT